MQRLVHSLWLCFAAILVFNMGDKSSNPAPMEPCVCQVGTLGVPCGAVMLAAKWNPKYGVWISQCVPRQWLVAFKHDTIKTNHIDIALCLYVCW